ncbi:tail-completion protein [Vibrio phage 1.177.O._10N.286.45.E10]|nr:tail-completion protein [Vibrio phage 1.177.O._10N.286.45.E10]
MAEFFDAVKVFEGDLKAKVSIPVENKSIPTDSVSMRLALNNADADGLFMNSNARVMTGQFNVEISAPLGSNKYAMMASAGEVLSVYSRGYSLQVGDSRMVIMQVNQSSPYSTDAHQKINVIIDFQFSA